MILFFKKEDAGIIAVGVSSKLGEEDIKKLTWAFSGAKYMECDKQFRQIEKLKRVLQDKKNEALAVNADLSQLSRQSNVKNMISESSVDVAESTLPPFMIKK